MKLHVFPDDLILTIHNVPVKLSVFDVGFLYD